MSDEPVFTYEGKGRCVVRNKSDAGSVTMDAPPRCCGSGEHWSPGDWLGCALAGCVVIMMDNAAKENGFDISGAGVETAVEMGSDAPPKVSLLKVRIRLPRKVEDERILLLKQAAHRCPIHNTMLAGGAQVVVELVNG